MWIVFHYKQMHIEVFQVVHKLYWSLFVGLNICICFKQVLNISDIYVIYDIETNKCTSVYHIIHTLYLLHASVTHVAFLREVHYKGQIRRNIAELFEQMHRSNLSN